MRDAAKLAGVSPPGIRAAEAKHQLAAQHIKWREELRRMDTLAAEDVNTTSLAAAITTAEASGVEPSELDKARVLLARTKAAQEVQRLRKEI